VTRCKHGMVEAYCAFCQAPRVARETNERKSQRRVQTAVEKRLVRSGELNATTLAFLRERANIRFQCAPRHLDWLHKLYVEVTHESLDEAFVYVYERGDEIGESSNGVKGALKWSWSSIVTFTATEDELALLDLGDVEIHDVALSSKNARAVTNNDFTIALLSYGLRPKANARLIAAAPEQDEALGWAEQALRDLGHAGVLREDPTYSGRHDASCSGCEAYRRVRAVIAKARGEDA